LLAGHQLNPSDGGKELDEGKGTLGGDLGGREGREGREGGREGWVGVIFGFWESRVIWVSE